MNFLLGKFLQSLIKKAVSAAVAFLTGPLLSPWLLQFGITIDPVVLSTGIFAAIESLRVWLTHQKWSSKLPKWLLAIT